MNSRVKWGEIPAAATAMEVFPELDGSWPRDGLGPVAVIVAQLPDPAALEPGALVMVRESGAKPKGLRGLLFGLKCVFAKPPQVHPAVRCTAMLARGYGEISSAPDKKTGEKLVWGVVRS